MTKSKIATALVCFALQACSSAPPQDTRQWQVAPVLSIRDSAGSAEAWYQLGRGQLAQGRLAPAEAALRHAIEQAPHHAAAHSAMGVLLARRGDLAGAIDAFQAGIANGGSPGVYNNFGYALYLQGNYGEAVRALKKAAAMDPGNGRAWFNLGLAEEKAGDAEGARRAFGHAEELAGIEKPGSERAETGHGTVETALTDTLVELVPGIFELRGPAQNHVSIERADYRLEVANGNGVPGLARRVAAKLGALGLPRARLGNQKPYTQPLTEIQYRKGYEAAATRVGKHLDGLARLRPVGQGAGQADVRLVLGRDLRDPARQAAITAVPPALAAAGTKPANYFASK